MIFKTLKKIAVTGFIVIFCFFSSPSSAKAIGVSFGGLDLFTLPCFCTPVYSIHFFAPFFYNNSVPIAGSLIYGPGSITFAHYYIHPGAYALGSFIPGAGNVCLVGVDPYCYPYPLQYGLISFPTGTSP